MASIVSPLDQFVSRIKNFDSLSASAKIEYFLYFLTVMHNSPGVTPSAIEKCFSELKIQKYSNIPQYLKLNSKRTKSKKAIFVNENNLYHLERTRKLEIDALLGNKSPIEPSDDYFPIDLFENTRGYLESIAKQCAACYDGGLFDACSVMTRKLLEVLIIETFERHRISSSVKDNNGNFFYLSDLIDKFRNETSWNIGRNTKESLPKLKKMGDLSAHNRRFFSKKSDVDKLKDDLRIVVEELIHIIDYPNWK